MISSRQTFSGAVAAAGDEEHLGRGGLGKCRSRIIHFPVQHDGRFCCQHLFGGCPGERQR